MTDDWKSQLVDLIREDVEIAIGEEYVATVVRSITLQVSHGAVYELAGRYKGWKVLASATMLAPPRDDLRPYQADGDIEVHLSRSWQPNANKE